MPYKLPVDENNLFHLYLLIIIMGYIRIILQADNIQKLDRWTYKRYHFYHLSSLSTVKKSMHLVKLKHYSGQKDPIPLIQG